MIALALTRHINTSKIYYAISAALLGISATIDKTSFFYLCVLVVLYGMLMATVHLEGFTRNEKITLRKSIVLKRMLLSNLYHPLVFLVFFFVSSTI
ncbi:hypothetical protein COV93_04280 [Candidatus Woesearchaeota archaeon CG11_big_fil_rev_8_21_14_0_20_43_8]|nr:MAG: hypothetical protein COV93_04280 [Candidatus Woesearchaeota archaeon CG11_big_fil_rev_8_21_14_0_20_43_8]PIO07007.1 MAG: hypothetical protein COT47_01880 [Candidatus Woesearchaeota archaeon CG08_land_8_20_14_0_20_43_7]